MKPKSIVTVLLLLFVGASVGFLIYKESRNPTEAKEQTLQTPANDNVPVSQPAVNETTVSSNTAKNAVPSQEPARSAKQTSQAELRKPGRNIETTQGSKLQHKVIAYYFHGNTRCTTCRMIEDFSRIAVTTGFPDEMNSGKVEFKAINVENPGNKHFVDDYKLVTRSVVLARYSGDKQEKWKNLDRVWDLVRNREAFERYVRDETKKFLEGS